MKITGADGKEMEVFTSEEVETKTKEAVESAKTKAIDEYKAANPDKGAELSALQVKLSEAETKIKEAEMNDDDAQKKRLREERDVAKQALADGLLGVDKIIDEKLKSVIGDTKIEFLDRFAAGDAELRKKIEFEFDNYRTGDTSKKGIQERMEKAYQLATGKDVQGIFDGTLGGGDRGEGGGYKPPETKDLNPNEKAIGTILGVTDEDRANYKKFQTGQDQKRAAGLIP